MSSPDDAGKPAPRIAFVDDDQDTATLFRIWCKRWGFVSCVESDSTKALQTILEFRPDVVFLDVVMPNLDGFGVLEQLQREPETRETPVVMLSGGALQSPDRLKGLDGGAVEYLAKPINASEMHARILSYLNILSIRREEPASEEQELQAIRDAQGSLGRGLEGLLATAARLDGIRLATNDRETRARQDLLTRTAGELRKLTGLLRELERELQAAYPSLGAEPVPSPARSPGP